ncbi:cytochrome o ubiquinol oxidase subunit IV [Massilia sp. METH4]|uniref:cytochrome o ubiquinol oxidase subunit IV n=1 Tax=Massilia sp. METH4 TaxID=3123041 RepID=UPI0030CCBF1B
MSDHKHHGHDDHGHGDHHDDHHDAHHDGSAVHGSMRDYVIGFVLSVILTAIPFWLVMNKVITDSATTGFVILGIGAVQMIVHMVYFLHMNAKSEGGWNMLALIFTVIIVVITLAGSLWVMYHMNKNMMPNMPHVMTPQQAHDMP